MSGDKEALKKLSYDLAKTERNFLLKKGETTIVLRTEELSQTGDRTMMDLMQKFNKQGHTSGGATSGEAH